MGEKEKIKLDLNKLLNEKATPIDYHEALKDVTPIEWSEEVLSGEKKVVVSSSK